MKDLFIHTLKATIHALLACFLAFILTALLAPYMTPTIGVLTATACFIVCYVLIGIGGSS